MGCDYYIVKALKVLLKEERIPLLIELERDYGYFTDVWDSDDPDYDEKLAEIRRQHLKPVMLPIIIYENETFMNAKLEHKYRLFIEEELFMNKHSWAEVDRIEKIEYRYERD